MTWLMSKDGVPQPDLALKILPEHGGQSSVSGKYAAGAPELILEVGHSTFAKDSGPKLRLYERSGVREYVTLRPAKRQLTWRELVKGKYHEIEAGADGWLRSRVFPGLWLDPQALWNNDLPGLSAAVHRGVATEEHAAFLRELARRKR
jgi:Uma2 family endonuclease